MKKILFVVYQSPVGSIWVNEAFRTAFGMYGEDIEPSVLLINEACTALAKDSKPENLGLLPIKMVQKFIDRYETSVLTVKEDLEKYCVKILDDGFKAKILEKKDLDALFHDNEFVIFM